MTERHFKVATWFVWMNFVLIPLSFVFAGVMVMALWSTWATATIPQKGLYIVVGGGFFAGALYTIRTIPRYREVITVTDTSLIQKLANGDSVSIAWDEEIVLRNRAVLGRLEVIGGYGARMIQIEHQLKDYSVLVALIQTKATRLRSV